MHAVKLFAQLQVRCNVSQSSNCQNKNLYLFYPIVNLSIFPTLSLTLTPYDSIEVLE